MDIWVGIVVFISSGIALLALWRASMLRKDVDRLTRNEYYRDGRMREISGEFQATLETIRIHLARLAGGQPVAEDLIRSGRLYRDITAEAAVQLLEIPSPEVYVLDVRTTREYAVKRLPSAKSIPLEELENRCHAEIPKEVKTLIVYCASGDRSQLACDFLSRRGFASVHHLLGGVQQWKGPTEGMGNVQLVQIQSRSKVHQDDNLGEKISPSL